MVKKKKNSIPVFILIHYCDEKGIYNFKITTPEKSEKVKNELIKAGMKDVKIPLLEYKGGQESGVK